MDIKLKAEALAAFDALPDDAKMRPRDGSTYSKLKYGFGTERSFAKWRCVGGGPDFCRAGPSIILYEKSAIDRWAQGKISKPVSSTSEAA